MTRRRSRGVRPGPEGQGARQTAGEPTWKLRVALAIVLLVGLWPLAHRALVAVAGTNPWKLGGFAMYTVPAPPLALAVHGLRERRPVRLDPATLDAALRGAMLRFEAEHHALGALRPPDELARRILDADPSLTQVSIVVQRMSLDRTTALLTAERVQYVYDPRGSRAVRRLP